MRRAVSTASKTLLAILAVPVAALAGLLSWVFNFKAKLSATEVATYLRDFIEGNSGDWDWDDFTSVPIADPQLDDIRLRAAAVTASDTEDATNILRGLLVEAERLAEQDS